MYKIVLGVVLCLFAIESSSQETRPVNKKIKGEILLNFRQQEECWNQKDIICFMEAYSKTEVVQTISDKGVVRGYDNILSNYKKKYFPNGTLGQLFFDRFSFRKLSKKLYFVTGRYNLRLKGTNDLISGWFSVVMKREKKKWAIITDHSS